jgi:Xaa-Pro aminopeptidase
MEKSIANRLKRVRDVLESEGADALLETHSPNIYYLSGFTGDAGILLVQPTSVRAFERIYTGEGRWLARLAPICAGRIGFGWPFRRRA